MLFALCVQVPWSLSFLHRPTLASDDRQVFVSSHVTDRHTLGAVRQGGWGTLAYKAKTVEGDTEARVDLVPEENKVQGT